MESRRRQLLSNLVPVRFDTFRNPDVTRFRGMLDNLSRPPQRILNPVFAFPLAVIAPIEPNMVKQRKLSLNPVYKQFDAIAIHDIRRMNFRFEDKALRVYQ